jgi:hypothetical protein
MHFSLGLFFKYAYKVKYMSLSEKPILENMNNSILGGRAAMPQKAPMSTNENQFSMNRVLYAKTINSFTNTLNEKTYYGGKNRDASSVIQRRNILAVGEKNQSGQQISFEGAKVGNDVRQAQKRVRNSGSVVPAKKIHKYAGSPVFY